MRLIIQIILIYVSYVQKQYLFKWYYLFIKIHLHIKIYQKIEKSSQKMQSQRTIQKHEIKYLIKQTLQNKDQYRNDKTHNYNIYSKLIHQKRIITQTKMQKLRNQMKIFEKLDNYIDFQDIYHRVLIKISQLFYARNSQKEKHTSTIAQICKQTTQLTFQIVQHPSSQISQLIQRINTKILMKFGNKIANQCKQQAQLISNLFQSYEQFSYENSCLNSDYFVQAFFKRRENTNRSVHLHTAYRYKTSQKKNKNIHKNKDIAKIYFTTNQKYQLSKYFHEALILLILAIQTQKDKISYKRLDSSKSFARSKRMVTTSLFNSKGNTERSNKMHTDITAPEGNLQHQKRSMKRQQTGQPSVQYKKLSKKRPQINQFQHKIIKLIQKIDQIQDKNKRNKINIGQYIMKTQQQYKNGLEKMEDQVLLAVKQAEIQIVDRARQNIHSVQSQRNKRSIIL